MNKIYLVAITCGLISVFGCKKPFEEPTYDNADLDFTNYIAVGNSLTQGYQNGGVYAEGQASSYPSIIAQQMKLVEPNMGDFVQPIFEGDGSGYIHLEYEHDEIQVIKPEHEDGYKEDASFEDASFKNVQLNNLGVSGIKLIGATYDQNKSGDKIASYVLMSQNPYGSRMFELGTNDNPITYLEHVARANGTFFTSWLGNNDILGYGTNGGVELGISIQGTLFYVYGLSDPAEFRLKYDMSLDSLTKNGAKGIVATLPNITSIPYFNVVKLEDIKNGDGSQADVYIEDNDAVRKATMDDVLLLPVASKIGKFEKDSLYGNGATVTDDDGNTIMAYSSTPYGLGAENPIKDEEVLSEREFDKIAPAQAALNAEIRASAAAHNIPVVDMESYLEEFESGFDIGGVEYSTKYIEGGVFSLDGVHPNSRGYAIIANKFIEAINENYGTNIPTVNINNYKGIVFP